MKAPTILLISLILLLSCSSEEIKYGCTNYLALNYDIDANTYDGSCIFEGDKFFGKYIATSTCDVTGPWHNIPFEINIVSHLYDPKKIRLLINHPSGSLINIEAILRYQAFKVESRVRANPIGFCDISHGHYIDLEAFATLEENTLTFQYFRFYGLQNSSLELVCSQICDVVAVKSN